MGRSAKLTSIDAVEILAGALQRFGEDATNALDDLNLEVRRAIEWMQEDRRVFWKQEVRRNNEKVAEAKLNLQQTRTFHRAAGREPSCYDEKKALERANRRLRASEQKTELVRQWSRTIQRAVDEYTASISQLARWLEADLPRAQVTLGRLSAALESYLSLQSAAPDASKILGSLIGPQEDAKRHGQPETEEQAAKEQATEEQEPSDGARASDRPEEPVDRNQTAAEDES